MTTDNGTIEIELNDPPKDVKVEVDGKTVVVKDKGLTYRLRAGKHRLEVSGPGFQTYSEEFSIVAAERRSQLP